MLAFMAIAAKGGVAEVDLIKGLGHALSVLLEGLFLATIAVFAHVVFKNRLHHLMLTTGAAADVLLTRAHDQGR